MPLSYHIPARFHPGYSPLGRWLRRRTGDARQAEAYQLVALAGVALGTALGLYLAAALLPPPTGSAWIAWAVPPGAALVALVAGTVGFMPAVTATCLDDHLELRQGRDVRRIAYADVRAVETVDALRYHRHYRRYAATRAFPGRLPARLLLLHTPTGPVVLGLPEAARRDLAAALAARCPAPLVPETDLA